MPAGEVVEAAVGPLRHALAREHARRVLVLAAIGIDAARVRVGSRQVFSQQERELRAPVLVAGRRDLRQSQVRERLRVVRSAHHPVAHAIAEFVGRCSRAARGPFAQQRKTFRSDLVERQVVCAPQGLPRGIALAERRLAVTLERRRQGRLAERRERTVQAVGAARGRGFRKRGLVRVAPASGDFREIAHPRAGNDRLPRRHAERGNALRLPGPDAAPFFVQAGAQRCEQRIDACVVELARDGRKDRQLLWRRLEQLAVARYLLANVTECVLGAALLVLVEDDEIREVQHVDLLELAGGAIVAGHDVHRQVDQVHDFGVALADARGLDHDQVEARGLQELHRISEDRGGREVLAPRRQRAHEQLRVLQRVHADAVTEQRAAGAPARRVHRHDRHPPIRKVADDAAQDFVGQRGLAGSAGAGDAEHGRPVERLGRRAAQPRDGGLVALLEQRDRARKRDRVVRRHLAALEQRARRRAHAPEHVLDHAVEPELRDRRPACRSSRSRRPRVPRPRAARSCRRRPRPRGCGTRPPPSAGPPCSGNTRCARPGSC